MRDSSAAACSRGRYPAGDSSCTHTTLAAAFSFRESFRGPQKTPGQTSPDQFEIQPALIIGSMFFRREKPHQWTFEERSANLRQLGFETRASSASKVLVTRRGYGAMLERLGEGQVKLGKAGLLVGDEIAELVNAGYQMF